MLHREETEVRAALLITSTARCFIFHKTEIMRVPYSDELFTRITLVMTKLDKKQLNTLAI